MVDLINKKMLEDIRNTGCFTKNGEKKRIDLLDKYELPYDKKADNVVVTGCLNAFSLMFYVKHYANILDHYGVSYTCLSKEYCCGNYLYRPAIKVKDFDILNECKELSKEFVWKNIEQAKELGASRVIIFCPPCYPIYKEAYPEENVIFWPESVYEVMDTLKYDAKIDYYAGCYKLHKYFSDVPMDLKSTDDVLSKIEGLEINRIDAPDCCFKPNGLKYMVDNVETKQMVHICTGCYGMAKANVPKDKNVDIMMLSKFIDDIINLQ